MPLETERWVREQVKFPDKRKEIATPQKHEVRHDGVGTNLFTFPQTSRVISTGITAFGP